MLESKLRLPAQANVRVVVVLLFVLPIWPEVRQCRNVFRAQNSHELDRYEICQKYLGG